MSSTPVPGWGRLRLGRPVEVENHPVARDSRADRLVEADRARVAAEHEPLKPSAAARAGDARERVHQRTPDAMAAPRRHDVQVFEVDAVDAHPRREGEEVERDADDVAAGGG